MLIPHRSHLLLISPRTGANSGGVADLAPEQVRELWLSVAGKEAAAASAETFTPSGQDVVQQMIYGLGWR